MTRMSPAALVRAKVAESMVPKSPHESLTAEVKPLKGFTLPTGFKRAKPHLFLTRLADSLP